MIRQDVSSKRGRREGESKRKRKGGKREPDTRLIISIFHSDALDEKGRGATSGDYKRPLLFHLPCTPTDLLSIFFFFSFFSPRSRFSGATATTAAAMVDPYLMVLSRVRTGGNLLQRFARGSIYQGLGRRVASAR